MSDTSHGVQAMQVLLFSEESPRKVPGKLTGHVRRVGLGCREVAKTGVLVHVCK